MARIVLKTYVKRSRKKRPGIHSKNKSRTKNSKQYVKKYVGQGRI